MMMSQMATAVRRRIQPDAVEREPLAPSASGVASLTESCLGEHESSQKPHGPRAQLLKQIHFLRHRWGIWLEAVVLRDWG